MSRWVMRPGLFVARAAGLLAAVFLSLPSWAQPSYVLFESGPVRPIALSPSGSKLFAVNIPGGHLEIFDVVNGILEPAGSVQVGLEPVAVAARSETEVWVVNHLSDSVSIVDLSGVPRVVRTLLVGDEPRDIVFTSNDRAFISTAHRGQHRTHASISGVTGAGDPQFTTEGVGRADVWVFDATDLGTTLGGTPDAILSFFADTPRALATDGSTVYVAAFHSGNQSTAIPELLVPNAFVSTCDAMGKAQGVAGPGDNTEMIAAPQTGVIVKWNGTNWVDSLGCTHDDFVLFDLPDHDVFSIDATTLAAGAVAEFDHVGTILFNMVTNPVSGKLYVTNTESPNEVRFEGPGDHGGSTVQGRLSEARISVLDTSSGSVDPQHLNQHIDYSQLHTDDMADHAAIDAQIPHSLATPLQMVISGGATTAEQTVYVAAYGSAKVGVFSASALEDGDFETNFDPTAASADYLATGGGPAGLALDSQGDWLYVYTRFDHAVSAYPVGTGATVAAQTMRLPTPEPASVIEGRPFLYDAVATSGNGEASCASCHIFADMDGLAWNLGNPDDVVTTNPQPQIVPQLPSPDFHPMKGPMTTQTLRGLSTHGGLHWRGDRTNGELGLDPCNDPTGSACDEELSFDNFIVAFEGLIERHGQISVPDMEKFTDFALDLMLPPNPVAGIDGTLSAEATQGALDFVDPLVIGDGAPCDACHLLDPAQGFFGAGGEQSFENEPQNFKIAHLRNAYQKIGMFGTFTLNVPPPDPPLGDQVRGFGFLHDGTIGTLFTFLEEGPFNLTPTQSRNLEAFMLAFPTDVAPVVGQQMNIGPGTFTDVAVNGRIGVLDTRAGTTFTSLVLGGVVTECDVIVNTVESTSQRGYVRLASGLYRPDDGSADLMESVLRDKADPNGAAQDLVYTCVPPGSGTRMGIDRDLDSVHDGLDNCPAWPNAAALGTCTAGDSALLASRCTSSAECGTGGFCSLAQEDGDSDGTGDACETVLLPEPGRGTLLLFGVGLLVALNTARCYREVRAHR